MINNMSEKIEVDPIMYEVSGVLQQQITNINPIPRYDTLQVNNKDGAGNALEIGIYYQEQVVGYFNQTFNGSNNVTQTVLLDQNSGVLATWNVSYDASGKFYSVQRS
jgi:hypothetical protein